MARPSGTMFQIMPKRMGPAVSRRTTTMRMAIACLDDAAISVAHKVGAW